MTNTVNWVKHFVKFLYFLNLYHICALMRFNKYYIWVLKICIPPKINNLLAQSNTDEIFIINNVQEMSKTIKLHKFRS